MTSINISNVTLGDKKAAIWYLGHSGWAVKTKAHVLFFDYTRSYGAHIDPDGLQGENVVVFASHQHLDHYEPALEKWDDPLKGVTYVYGWRRPGQENIISVPPREILEVGDIKIATMRSTDAGVGFLVHVDSLTLFHAGDHANWEDNEPGISYEDEIDHIASQVSHVDIAFLPVTSFAGVRAPSITQGALYAIHQLTPSVVFPMHGNNREPLYQAFAKDAMAHDVDIPILCAEEVGEQWWYPQ
jgi:L-ascorbate metabolism protein UlaG (beta-lactamase superfamily)